MRTAEARLEGLKSMDFRNVEQAFQRGETPGSVVSFMQSISLKLTLGAEVL